MIYEVVRVLRATKANTDDLVTIKQAAKISGRIMSTISRMMDAGKLPEYRVNNDMDGPRYTSRVAIEAMQSKPV